ncbi:MAG: hypothetical protein ACXABY_14470 [Candidatus Thorarchaeota archaeon]|jgi:hypothetical protein
MGFNLINFGIELTIPTTGTVNWASVLESTTWQKLSEHRHTGAGDGNKIPSEGLATNFGWTQATTLTPTGTTETLDFNLGNVQVLDLSSATGDVTVTLANPNQGSMYHIIIIQGATPRDVIWPVAAKWPQGQKPILSTASGAKDKIVQYYDGVEYLGDWNLDYK